VAQTHHYLFDTATGFNDSTGSINFTNYAGTIDASGKINQAFRFANLSMMPTSTAGNLLPTSGAFTIAFWMKESYDGPYLVVFTIGNMVVVMDGENGYLGINGTGGGFTIVKGSGADVFAHYIISTNGLGSWTVYKNNVSQVLYGTQWTPNAAVYNSLTAFSFNGGDMYALVHIDDLRIYNEVIDSTERAFIYNSGTGTQSDSGGGGGGGGGGSPSPVTSAFYKFQPFVEAAMEGIHNLGSHQLKVALTDTAPSAANAVLADISQIASYAGCSTRNVVTSTSLQTSGTYKLVCDELVLTASGAVGPFRYVVLYNDTAADDNLIAYYDYASSVTLASGDTFTIGFNGTTGVLTVT
jgi:hypothetical protein